MAFERAALKLLMGIVVGHKQVRYTIYFLSTLIRPFIFMHSLEKLILCFKCCHVTDCNEAPLKMEFNFLTLGIQIIGATQNLNLNATLRT